MNFIEPMFAVGRFGVVDLIDANNQLLDAERVGQERMFTRLSVLRDARLKLASARGHDQHGAVSLDIWHACVDSYLIGI